MRAGTKTWTVAVIASGLVAGCDGRKSIGIGKGQSIAIDDYAGVLEDRLCAELAACSQVPDQATCQATFSTERGTFPTLVGAVHRGTVTYDGRKAAECVDSLGTLCDQQLGGSDSCDETFLGTIPAGGACVVDEECANHAGCMFPPGCTDACCVGVCGNVPMVVPVGVTCSRPGTRCTEDAYCDGRLTCATKVGPGGACTGSDACQPPYFCEPATSGTSSWCVLAAASGAACEPNRLRPCARADEYCEPSTSRCTHRKLPGQACEDEICVGYAHCQDQIRIAFGGVGQACDEGINWCQGLLECLGGVCTVSPPGPVCTP